MNKMDLIPEGYDSHTIHYPVYCVGCGTVTELILPLENYEKWRNSELAQQAFSYLSSAQRELIVSGTHPECFDKLFPEE